MAIQSSFYLVDGTTRTFPSTKPIATKQHCAIYLRDAVLLTWSAVGVDSYSLINNSLVFDVAPASALYSELEVRVVDSQSELTDSPSNTAIVAGSIANINTVATDIDNVNTSATNINAINSVSTSITNVNTVAANIVGINTVSTNVTDVSTVASSIANVNAVATDLLEPTSEINTVAVDIANVNIVGGAITNVNIVATDIANVNSVATTVVPNIAEILLADDNAIIATTKAGLADGSATEAEHWANYTTDLAVPEGIGEFSAKHYATKASESAASIDPLTLVRKDSDTGAAYIPSGTTAQRPVTPSSGYMRFNTTLSSAEVWNGTMWTPVGGGATGGGSDTVFVETSYTVTQDYTITAGKSAMTVGDADGNVTIQDGVTVTIPDGASWAIIGA